jgi:hypothetical protein
VDAGCIRTDEWCLDDFTKRNTFSEPGVYTQLICNLPDENFFQYIHGSSYIAGSHILFHRDFILSYIEKYKEMIQLYIDNKLSIIDDQYIIASMSKTCIFLKPILYDNIPCADKWFFFFNLI